MSLILQAGELKPSKSQVNFPAGLGNHSVNWMLSQSWKGKVAIGQLFQVLLRFWQVSDTLPNFNNLFFFLCSERSVLFSTSLPQPLLLVPVAFNEVTVIPFCAHDFFFSVLWQVLHCDFTSKSVNPLEEVCQFREPDQPSATGLVVLKPSTWGTFLLLYSLKNVPFPLWTQRINSITP